MAPLSKAVLDFGAIANRMQIEQSRLAETRRTRGLSRNTKATQQSTSVYATRRYEREIIAQFQKKLLYALDECIFEFRLRVFVS